MTDHLDTAHQALRAWCHDRPDQADPSISDHAFGTIAAILPTLEHIIALASRATMRATGADDDRTVSLASGQVVLFTNVAAQSLEDCHRAVGQAHEIVGHLAFGVPDDGDPRPVRQMGTYSGTNSGT